MCTTSNRAQKFQSREIFIDDASHHDSGPEAICVAYWLTDRISFYNLKTQLQAFHIMVSILNFVFGGEWYSNSVSDPHQFFRDVSTFQYSQVDMVQLKLQKLSALQLLITYIGYGSGHITFMKSNFNCLTVLLWPYFWQSRTLSVPAPLCYSEHSFGFQRTLGSFLPSPYRMRMSYQKRGFGPGSPSFCKL